jgi:membrane-bound lytic murein transglycosylase D
MSLQKPAWLIVFLFTTATAALAQATQYNDMSRAERLVFVTDQARRIAHDLSGNDYQFTPEFTTDIQKAVTHYAERIGKPDGPDLLLVLQRGQVEAPVIIAAFKKRHVSPLIGLYLPWIESEYQNIQPQNPAAAVGMFQFLPSTGERFGLSPQDLLDVSKSADAAARYMTVSLSTFKEDPMKEALALLAYNRGAENTTRDLKLVLNNQNGRCSICALTADRNKLDDTFKYESVAYVPRFFAAAIIGENPQAFGIQMQPLSSQ